MFELFDSAWEDLTLEHVRDFLDDAGDEPLTWEAKADDERGRLHARSVQKAVCGLTNQIGGYLIIGAKWDKDAAVWSLPGITPPGDEMRVWLGKIIRGLSPTPRWDVQPWTLDGGRLVAVVRVEPVAQPPCMTPDGRVFQRVSGETIPVRDPTLLNALMTRGREARERADEFAEQAADTAVRTLMGVWPWEHALSIAAGLAPVARETDDISSRLFVPSFEQAIEQAIWPLFGGGDFGPKPSEFTWRIRQESFGLLAHFTRTPADEPSDTAARKRVWFVQGRWDGSVAAGIALNTAAAEELDISFARGIAVPAWTQLEPLCQRLGGYGPATLAMQIYRPEPPQVNPQPMGGLRTIFPIGETVIAQWVTLGADASEGLARMNREIERAGGYLMYEPEG